MADDHVCGVCFTLADEHPEWCEGHDHWPPLCCPGCPCESYEEAHPDWCNVCGETPDAGRDALVDAIHNARMQWMRFGAAYSALENEISRAVLPIIDRLVAEARKDGAVEALTSLGNEINSTFVRLDFPKSEARVGLAMAAGLLAEHRQRIEADNG